jgi:methyl-accepting chemotaxis protein
MAIKDQRGGVSEIANAVHRLTTVNATNVESAMDTKKQASSLKIQAQGLGELVEELTTTLLGAKVTEQGESPDHEIQAA